MGKKADKYTPEAPAPAPAPEAPAPAPAPNVKKFGRSNKKLWRFQKH